MLAVHKTSGNSDKCALNVLPCRIQHNGPSKVTKRHWDPTTEKDGSKTSYFRGRKLKGTTVALPSGYEAIVVKSTERTLTPPKSTGDPVDSEDEDEPAEPVKILETVSKVAELTVWDHDQQPASDDAFRKGVEEWLTFSQAIHGS